MQLPKSRPSPSPSTEVCSDVLQALAWKLLDARRSSQPRHWPCKLAQSSWDKCSRLVLGAKPAAATRSLDSAGLMPWPQASHMLVELGSLTWACAREGALQRARIVHKAKPVAADPPCPLPAVCMYKQQAASPPLPGLWGCVMGMLLDIGRLQPWIQAGCQGPAAPVPA